MLPIALPLLSKILGGATLVAVAVAGVQTVRLSWAHEEIAEIKQQRAEDIAAAERAVRNAMQADIDLGNALAGAYRAQVSTLQGSLKDVSVRLAAAKRSPQCDRTPAADAFDQWLLERARDREAAPGQPGAAGRAGPAVPAGAPTPGRSH